MEETTVEKRYALSPAEQQYKILFQAAPCWYDAERYRYHTWQEFNEIYQQGVRGGYPGAGSPALGYAGGAVGKLYHGGS